MTHLSRTSRRTRGITLIEMMVALAITTFVVLVVNQLFNGVIQTVGRGTQAGEILQRSRAFDEQIANETELIISGGRDPKNNPYDWFGRMVGPKGRQAGQPGGFLVVVQRVVQAPVTIEDQLKQIARPVRSDQLMFIYDQTPLFDQTGKKRLPPMAPDNGESFGGDMINSINADYVRIWYGHAVQLPDDPSIFNLANHDLGRQSASNPNALAQDWVLGRQALFLTGLNPIVSGGPVFPPLGNYAHNVIATSNVDDGGLLWQGFTDITQYTLDDIYNKAGGPQLGIMPTAAAYQGQVLPIAFTQVPLVTAAKPLGTKLRPQDIAPTHTYFMGGVSDFIVEFAGDLVTGTTYGRITDAPNPDGELDRDPEGRIKWYSWFPNPDSLTGGEDPNYPVTYPIPSGGSGYTPRMAPALVGSFSRADAAFVWQNEGSNGFTSWPWMLRIRYRLHDRRGEFEGRQAFDPALGKVGPEAGAWFETIIPVNHQGL